MTEDYCKLASGIVLSTIWQEDDRTRIVWITMLALKDRDHTVKASLPGLARIANVPAEDCERALQKLQSPDPHSRTKDFDGRRIKEVEGGWLILNGEKYRNFMSKAERAEYQRILMQERREKERMLADVSKCQVHLAHTEAEEEADTETEAGGKKRPSRPCPGQVPDSKPKPSTDKVSPHKAIIEAYCQEFQEVFGCAYVFNGAKDGAAVARLVKGGATPQEVSRVARAGWAMDRFISEQAATLAGLASQWNVIRAKMAAKSKIADDDGWGDSTAEEIAKCNPSQG